MPNRTMNRVMKRKGGTGGLYGERSSTRNMILGAVEINDTSDLI